MMVLPRYSLRQLLAIMGASSLFFLVAAFAVRGQPWAVAITIGILVVALILVVQAGFFFAAWLFAQVIGLLSKGPGTRSLAVAEGTASPREPS
jgi:hypothetical protein